MNKSFINSEKEFVDLMFAMRYWTQEELRKNYRTKSWISLPEKYPCVLVHTWKATYYNREIEDLEFIYLDDFNLEECQCGRLVQYDTMRWSDGRGAALCESCHEEYYQ